MGFHIMFPAKMVFLGITAALFCLGADSEPIKSNDSPKTSFASQKLSELLSPAIFSKVDPFQYLVRESSKILPWHLKELNENLQSGLKTNQFAERYIPYARALQSIIRGLLEIQDTIYILKEIRKTPNLSSVPAGISSPPELSEFGLYSTDIFSDPQPAVPLFDKLLRIPKKDIPNLILQLEKFASIIKSWRYAPLVQRRYPQYAGDLASFLRKNYYIVADMKREMASINRLSGANNSAVNISDETDTESDDSLGIIGASDNLSNILSSAVFSNPDPFQYLLRKSSLIQTSAEIEQLMDELQFRLRTGQFSNRYAPYARALYSIMNCRNNLRTVNVLINRIRTDPDYTSTNTLSPSEFTSSGVFSSDILNDPDPVSKLVDKFLQIPTKGILQLRSLIVYDINTLEECEESNDAPIAWKKYISYAEALLSFLRKESVLSELGRERVEIQRITMANRQTFDDNVSKKEPESSVMSG